MIIKGKEIKIRQVFCLALYYGFAQYLPKSNTFGNMGGGVDIEIGDYSGIGINAQIPNGTIIGDYVMMGPNCFIMDVNHRTSDVTKPMALQGMVEKKITKIGNDVWIGREVHMTSGRTIADGTIVAMASVLTKDFPPYSVVGGNPARLIKSRK